MNRNIVPAAGVSRLISSRTTFMHKRVFPVIWFGFLAVFVLVVLLAPRGPRSAGPFVLVMPFFMGIFGFLFMRKLLFDLVDEVWDAGSTLLIKSKGYEVRVELSQIMNVSYSMFSKPPRVTLSLRQSTSLGSEIAFIPPTQLWPFSRSPIVDDLIRRVDAARLTASR
jgi:hypothetical protein